MQVHPILAQARTRVSSDVRRAGDRLPATPDWSDAARQLERQASDWVSEAAHWAGEAADLAGTMGTKGARLVTGKRHRSPRISTLTVIAAGVVAGCVAVIMWRRRRTAAVAPLEPQPVPDTEPSAHQES